MRAHLASVRNINEYREIQRLTGKKESWIGGTDASEVFFYHLSGVGMRIDKNLTDSLTA